MALRLSVNLIEHGKFLEAGEIVPGNFHVPAWVIEKHRLTEEEGAALCEDRRLRREEVARRKAGAAKADPLLRDVPLPSPAPGCD